MNNLVYLKIYLYHAETIWLKCSEELARNAINEISAFFEKIAMKEPIPAFYSFNDEKGSTTCVAITAIAGASMSKFEESKSDLLNEKIFSNQEEFKKMMEQYIKDQKEGDDWKGEK